MTVTVGTSSRQVANGAVDSFVHTVLYSRTLSYEHIKKLHAQLSPPLVLINRTLPEPLFHSVTFDQEATATMIMNHLIGYGHQRIACITGLLDNPTGNARLTDYINTLKKACHCI
ncbi:hypothetical protein DI392_15485 [Vibrio albus]|uniref:Periplasmic binding protein/LacI sugar binding domain-containing protein n=1 Tax=Vibrio albus TaxID=2200953 RepID=A0A2U3B6N0_9VIBR|nr:hypothetical protein DI392_15485 [Vibrio albus]